MVKSPTCEQCGQPAFVHISYLGFAGRVGYLFCQHHGRAFWEALSALHRETAICIDPRPASAEPEREKDDG